MPFSLCLGCSVKGRPGRNFRSKVHFRSHCTWKGFHLENLCDLEVPWVLLCWLCKMACWPPFQWLMWTDSSSWRGSVRVERHVGYEEKASWGLKDRRLNPWIVCFSLGSTCEVEVSVKHNIQNLTVRNKKNPVAQLQQFKTLQGNKCFQIKRLLIKRREWFNLTCLPTDLVVVWYNSSL